MADLGTSLQHLNSAHNVNVPFILMNSFNTDEDTARIIQKYANHRIELMTFNQSRYPRVNRETLLPAPKSALEDKGAWYPPGHGDLFDAIMNSGLVDKLLDQGKEYLFVSNVDNLGAVVDTRILEHMHKTGAEFLMEVTDKTKADVKGGTLINYEGGVRLLEIAQVPSDHVEDFKSVRKFKIFNTNNLWVNLRAIKRIMENDGMDLEIIVNNKTSDKGEAVIQLETAVGAAIKREFPHARRSHPWECIHIDVSIDSQQTSRTRTGSTSRGRGSCPSSRAPTCSSSPRTCTSSSTVS